MSNKKVSLLFALLLQPLFIHASETRTNHTHSWCSPLKAAKLITAAIAGVSGYVAIKSRRLVGDSRVKLENIKPKEVIQSHWQFIQNTGVIYVQTDKVTMDLSQIFDPSTANGNNDTNHNNIVLTADAIASLKPDISGEGSEYQKMHAKRLEMDEERTRYQSASTKFNRSKNICMLSAGAFCWLNRPANGWFSLFLRK